MGATEQTRHPVSLREALLLAALLIVYITVMVKLAHRTGITVDEPSHILSSILYWEGNDRLLPRDMPPLIKIVGGWAAAGAGFHIVEESHPVWKTNHEWNISMDMIRRTPGKQLQRAIFKSRLPMLLFPVLTTVLLWWWARQMFGPMAAILAALLFAAEPTSLGHAPLFKNDHAATFGFLLFFHAAWCYWRRPVARMAAYLGLALCVALLTKLSMMILIPIALLILMKNRDPIALALVLLIPYAGTIAACQFETRLLYGYLPLPAPLWDGVYALSLNANNENAVYLLGERHPWGSRIYFVIAALVKAPEIYICLFGAGLAVQTLRLLLRKMKWEDLLWLFPPAIYFAAASMSAFQLGFRLILPCLPFAILLMAAAIERLVIKRWFAGLVAFAILTPSLVYYPHHISYFNSIVGGPTRALKFLSDSNVDWGQDLAEVHRYIQKNNLFRIYLSYMGSDHVYAHLRRDEIQWIEPPFTETGKRITQLQPGPGIYAISANLITGQFLEKPYRDYYRVFREAKPIAYAGYSIYIYRLP